MQEQEGKGMDIGDKVKAARTKAGLTQEQAAQVLDVSRQTISHWENGKTSPAIVSVIKMSDQDHIRITHLLREARPASVPVV